MHMYLFILYILTLLLIFTLLFINTGKNPSYAQAKIKKVFAHNTVYCVKTVFGYFLLFTKK